jgi:hypothetical protein
MDWGYWANVATTLGFPLALGLALFAMIQHATEAKFHRDGLAHEKLNEVYRLALSEPLLADGHFDIAKLASGKAEDMEIASKYLWLYSAFQSHMEFLFTHFGADPGWRASIGYTLQGHRRFILSDWHREHGWWSMYDPQLRRFIAELFSLDPREVERWAGKPVLPDYADAPVEAQGGPDARR